jgi:hypothetical protein
MNEFTYLTPAQFCDKHQAFKLGGLRGQIFNENKNGLKAAGAVVRNGRKVLINESKYFGWIESKNQGGTL